MPEVDWFAIQENTFTRWCNDQLAERGRHIDDLKGGLKDGIALIHIIEVCTDKQIGKYNQHPKIEIQKVENLNLCFEFIKKQNVKLVNISAEDIITGNLRLILGLVWTLIQEYDIGAGGGDGLLQWVQSKIPEYNVVGWKKDWNDGRAVNALIDAICPGLMPGHKELSPETAVENCRNGIELAHTKLGVDPRVLPEEMAHPKVDKNAMQTYIAQFRNISQETIQKALAGEKPAYHELANAYGRGLSDGVVGEKGEVFVEVQLECTDPLQVLVQAGGQEVQTQGMARDKEGLYSCHYVPHMPGDHQVHVTLGGQHVPGSPFQVAVLQKESLGGEGKIRVFFSTTQMAGKGRSDVRNLEHLFKLKNVHLRTNFEPWHPVDLMDREDREAVFRKAGTRTLPIVFVNDEYVGDYDRILELDEAGQLDRILDLSDKDMITLEQHMERLKASEAGSTNTSFSANASFQSVPSVTASPAPAPNPAPAAAADEPFPVSFSAEPEDEFVETFTDIPDLQDFTEIDGLQD